MRKLIGALLAVTALVPVAAYAQEGRRGGSRFERQVEGVSREARQAVRAQRQEQRAQRQQQPQVQAQAQVNTPQRAERQANRVDRRADRQDGGIGRRGDRQEYRADRRDDRQDFRRERQQDQAQLANGQVTRREFRNDRRDDRQDFRAERRDDRQDFRRDQRGDQNRGGNWAGNRLGGNDWDRSSFNRNNSWNRGWRQDNRYDWNRYRGANRQAYRLPRYYAPYNAGYGYRRFNIGVSLSSAFWGQNYWLDDPFAYRLPPAYGPYRWVRYYDDALLVDLRSGQVVDAVYGIFW
jgi:hypothetical protein